MMEAESAEAFLSEQPVGAGWQMVAALKSEIDRLAGSDLDAAERLAARLERLAALMGDSISEAFAQAGRAAVLNHWGQYDKAQSLYESAITAMRAAKLSSEAAVLQIQQVAVLRQMGRYDDALRTARAARRVLTRSEPAHLAQLESNVGNVYYRLDRYKKALDHYDRAHEIFSIAGDDTMRGFIDFNRSNIFLETDRPDEAQALLDRAAAAFDRTGQSLFAAEARFHIAYLQFLRGNYNIALTGYHRVRDQLERLGSAKPVAWCHQEIAEIMLALNAFDEAAENAAAAQASFKRFGMPYESAQATLVESLARMGLGELERAQVGLMEAREAFARSRNSILTALVDSYLAELAIRRNDFAEASARAISSARVFARNRLATKCGYARVLQARAAYAEGDLTRAARMAKLSLKTIEGAYAPAISYQCHNLIGRIERDRNRKRQAIESFRRAVDTVEQMRGGIAADEFKATFLRDKIEAYEDAITACLDEGSPQTMEEAFRYVESSKSRALADLLARYVRGEGKPSESGVDPETRAHLKKLIEDLNWYSSHANLEDEKGDQRNAASAARYRNSVVRCERQIARLFRRMESEGSAFAEIQRLQPATGADLRGALEADETAIEYFITEDQVSAFVVTRDRIKVVRAITSRREAEQQLAALRFQLEKFNYGPAYVDAHFGQLRRAADEHLTRLYEMVFAPLESLIEGTRLVVIPHGALHYVPFHALRDGAGFLVDRFELSYAPSAAVLKLCRSDISNLKHRTAESGKMVALGVAECGTPSIEDEIHTLGAIFPDAIKLTGERATRDNLIRVAPEARFLHLASHGYFRRDNPMFSFLKLADSHLNFYSLLDLRINAEMVTLSACHTGVNMVFPGDELHGLMRGFMYAGVPSLVASLWAVSDRSTADFMSEMYSRIREGATKRAALRHAQLAIKEAYGHPYYWAPFVLMGNPI